MHKKDRAGKPRPYLDYDKNIPKRPRIPVGSMCQGRGEVPSPVYNLFGEEGIFELSDRLLE
jgi:hypothetical protein